MKRVFIAYKVSTEAKTIQFIDSLKKKLWRSSIKWVNPLNYHVTLKFIGNTDFDTVKKIKNVLKSILEDEKKFDTKIQTLKFFGHIKKPTALWMDIDDNGNSKRITENINKALGKIGIETDQRPFKPHLTLARIKLIYEKTEFEKLIEQNNDTLFQSNTISKIIFFESKLTQRGPEYKVLAEYKLEK
ncbi:MAG: RNA 2',3'-cyclic phosphodiesterase [Bacteroidota bacterium]